MHIKTEWIIALVIFASRLFRQSYLTYCQYCYMFLSSGNLLHGSFFKILLFNSIFIVFTWLSCFHLLFSLFKCWLINVAALEKICEYTRRCWYALFQNPAERLGCHSEAGFSDIQSHPFFRTIDWDQLEQKQIAPPYKPLIRSERDLEHFDPAFTDEPVQLTPDDPYVLFQNFKHL